MDQEVRGSLKNVAEFRGADGQIKVRDTHEEFDVQLKDAISFQKAGLAALDARADAKLADVAK